MKTFILLTAAAATAAGCSAENENTDEETVPDQDVNDNREEEAAPAQETPSAEELLEAAAGAYEDQDYYQERTVTTEADDGEAGDDENVIEEYYWEYYSEDGLLTRTEYHDEHGPTEYEVVIEPNQAVLHYTEGDEEASIEDPDHGHGSSRSTSLQRMLDEADDDAPREVDSSEIDGEEAYKLTTAGNDIWFRAEDYAEIRTEGPTDDYTVEVSTHEWNPEFDIDLFEEEAILPDDVTLIDRRGSDTD
ncbi:hypothetical protein [Alkalicoccus chagannorensis]|uniref:hypothetical protein n=1 Tax=Alkalicoccus chagannorensis TaxID=427072 RepID=UPI00041AE9BE|nr:hypothetical protein [Alkalicoccus chagannorensis]